MRFEAIAAELALLEASQVILAGVRGAAADERRHATLCARVAAAYGYADADAHEPSRERVGRPDIEQRDRLLWELTAVCCVAETINVALLTRCLEVTEDPLLRETLRALLRDEVRHSQLGWRHLAGERKRGRGSFLAEVLPHMLEASVHGDFFHVVDLGGEDLSKFGELPHSERVALYCDTLHHVVFPGLQSMGVDVSKGQAWLLDRLR